ncbi:hypothetical protein [Flammeovirga sp. SJP92]|uniref:hypothetical protein n=1 Tax=Flammeovirga sp. SJP92 TaxID=1775430 RepID=UPI0012F7DB3E|nr:hypothetical protein [Flammeovirga sp. SJP92]
MMNLLESKKVSITSVFLFIIGAFLCGFSLFQTHYATGWDSYFYMAQTKSWFEHGALHSPRINIVYPILIVFQFIIGDYLLSYKIVTILSYSSFIVLIFYFSYFKSKNLIWSIGVGLIMLFNPQLIYFASQFTKNLIGLNFFLLLLIMMEKRKVTWGVIVFMGCVLSHKLILALAVIYVLAFLSYSIFKKYFEKGASISLVALPIVAYFLILILLPSQLSESFQLPVISFIDSHHDVINLIWKIYVVGASFLFIFRLGKGIFFPKQLDHFQYSFLIVLSVLFLPFLKWDALEYSFRFWMVFGVISPLLLVELRKMYGVLLIGISVLIGLFSFSTYQPKLHDPPYKKYSFLSSSLAKIEEIENSELLIAHKSLAEFISYQLGIDVLPWGISREEATNKVYRLVYIPPHNKIGFLSIIEDYKIKRLSAEYVLLKEMDWLENIKPVLLKENEYEETWKNPYLIR